MAIGNQSDKGSQEYGEPEEKIQQKGNKSWSFVSAAVSINTGGDQEGN